MKKLFFVTFLILSFNPGFLKCQEQDQVKIPIKNDYYFSLHGAFIYWKSELSSLSYALTGEVSSKGEVFVIDRKYSPGFIVGVGGQVSDWRVNLDYTWYKSSFNNKTVFSELEIIPAFYFLPPLVNLLATSVLTNSNILYQTIDFEVGRNFLLKNGMISLMPFFGAKGLWQTQRYHFLFLNVQSTELDFMWNSNVSTRLKNYGLGPCLGLKSKWNFLKFFGITSRLSFGAIWLKYNGFRRDSLTITEGRDPNRFISTPNVKEDFSSLKPVIEMDLGLFVSSTRIDVELIWQSKFWINQALFVDLFNGLRSSDLSFYGINLKAGFKF